MDEYITFQAESPYFAGYRREDARSWLAADRQEDQRRGAPWSQGLTQASFDISSYYYVDCIANHTIDPSFGCASSTSKLPEKNFAGCGVCVSVCG